MQIGARLQMPASTVHAVLVRCRINRLSHIDLVTGEPIRRYEHPHPGSMLHVDVTKFGNIRRGRRSPVRRPQQGDKNVIATAKRTGLRTKDGHARTGKAFLHTVIDDPWWNEAIEAARGRVSIDWATGGVCYCSRCRSSIPGPR